LKKTKFKGVTGEKVATKSTANEYANIFKKISKDKRIRNYLDQKSYEYEEVLNKDERSKHFDKHSNKLLQKEASLPFEILASKTGYLHEAGANLAMLIKDRNTEKKYIIVTMGNPNLENKFVEPKQLGKWALKQFN
jgi:D-alanyl-D-alanine carboxypeptidase